MILSASQAMQQALREHASFIGPPATAREISDFEGKTGVFLHDGLKLLYSLCSSVEASGESLISIWPLDRLIPVVHQNDSNNSSIFIIGDFMLYSDEISADLCDPSKPIFLHFTQQKLAFNFDMFLRGLFEGRLN